MIQYTRLYKESENETETTKIEYLNRAINFHQTVSLSLSFSRFFFSPRSLSLSRSPLIISILLLVIEERKRLLLALRVSRLTLHTSLFLSDRLSALLDGYLKKMLMKLLVSVFERAKSKMTSTRSNDRTSSGWFAATTKFISSFFSVHFIPSFSSR